MLQLQSVTSIPSSEWYDNERSEFLSVITNRYAQMIEHDNQNNTPIRVPLTEEDLNDLSSGETFHWCFNGIPVFLFNTDEYPELDPDSEEYDPSVSIF